MRLIDKFEATRLYGQESLYHAYPLFNPTRKMESNETYTLSDDTSRGKETDIFAIKPSIRRWVASDELTNN